MNALLNYPGAKWGMAEEIVSLMPPHRSYLEPFFGSGAVLFNKPPSAIETVNDIDGDIVNFFAVLREQPEEQKLFARWVNCKQLFRSCSWADYDRRR